MTFGNAVSSFLWRTLALLLLAASSVQAAETYVGVFFDVPSINAGGTATFSMQLRENDGTAFTNGAITVTYPVGLVNDGQYGDPLITEDCTSHGATITRTAGDNHLVVTGVNLAAFTFCDIYVRITGSVGGSYTITIPPGSFSSSTPPTTNIQTTSATLSVIGPILVTNTADSGAGSLRDAINTVNTSCGSYSGINFNIPGTGPFTISPGSQLPDITCPGIVIDGYSQPGSVANTNPLGAANTASIMIDLNGSSCGSCNGLVLTASGIQVDGLAIRSFNGQGIVSNPGSGTNAMMGNYVGIDPAGNPASNTGVGIEVDGGYANIGDGTAAGRNLVTMNGSVGILVLNGAASISGNQVGGLRDGSISGGNAFRGIFLSAANYSPNNIIGNLVLGNGGAGISVTPTTFTRVVIESNESFANSGPGIDINDDGPTANDEASPPYDTDSVQNYPVVTSVVQTGGNTVVSGYMKSIANRTATIGLYHNPSASPVTEGQLNIAGFSLPLDGTGFGTFSIPVPGSWDNISAQATLDTCNDGCLRSSEYSPKVAVSNPLVVTNTNDSGPGSLRDAINFVGMNCAAQTITFNIPGTGFHRIVPTSPLPAITCAGVAIDGYSQPGTAVNSHPQWSDAVITVEIYGGLISTGSGLDIAAANVSVSGLSIYGFNGGAGIYVSATAGTPGINVWGNFIGVQSDGNSPGGNGTGVDVSGGAAITIGGSSTTVHAQRNVISGATFNGVALRSGVGNLVQDNLIGTNSGGALVVANGTGIYASAASSQIIYNLISGNINGGDGGISLVGATGTVIAGNLIGTNAGGNSLIGNPWGIKVAASPGTTIGIPGTPNVISGSTINGIQVTGSSGVLIQGNKIGTDASGVAAMFNGDGIYIDSSPGSMIGGLGAGQGNLIAFNARHGIVVNSANAEISANSIYGNGQLGINLLTDADTAVPPNDSCDVDGGGNGLANFPVLAVASLSGGTMTLTGNHNSTANTSFRIEAFSSPAADNPANRGGRTYLGSFTVTTDGACNATFSGVVSAAAPGDYITATSTDPAGNTSSFSNAVVVTAPAGAVSFSTSSVDFGVQLSGVTSSPQTISVINTGNATLNISGATATAPFNIVGQTCGATLAAATSCTFDLTFDPTAPGTFTANFTLSSDAPATPTATLPLAGVAMLPPTFALATGTTVTPNQVTTISIHVSNPSSNPLAYSNFNMLLTYPAGYANDNPNGTYPQGGCGDPSFAGGTPGGNSIGASSGGSAAPGVACSRAAAQIFAPSTPGSYTFTIPTGGFTITSPFTYTNPSPITVTATVSPTPAPAVSVSTPSIAFASQPVFTTSAATLLTITNTGNATLNISSIFTSGDFGQTNTCTTGIAPTGTCAVSVTFTPDVPGSISGSLNIVSDDPASPKIVPLTGVGVALAPVVSLTPPSLTFASRTVSTTSVAQTITLANTGNGPLAISSITVSGDFAFTSPCPASLAAGASCTIDVTFTPLVAAARTGNITITDDASGSPHTVPLSGTGLPGAAAVATVSPGALDYPAQPVGSASVAQILTVSNTGSSPLTVTGVSVTGEFTIVTPAGAGPPQCPATILPGAACRIAVIFKPTGPNLRQGVLTIVSNGGTITVTVVGTGLVAQPPQLTMPTALDFGSQPVGVTSTGRAIAMHNQSTTTATVTELTATGDFDVSDTCATIAAGATCSPLVTFQPSTIGPISGTLTVRTLRDANSYVVNLSGIGTENLLPQLEVSAEFVGFGNVFIGEPVVKEVTLKNVGRQALQVSGIDFAGDYFGDGACIGSILPGNSCTLRVTFNAGIPGGRSGVMSIISNAPDSPHNVGLSGTGCFLPTPSHTRFGTLLCGS